LRAADTNVVLRILVRDDERQLRAAEDWVAGGAWVSPLVVAEVAWVLEAGLSIHPDVVADAIEMLLDHETLVVHDADVVIAALARFRKRPNAELSDCLILEGARKAGHLPLGTFDRDLSKLDDVELL
jgi:predicted nucleic-acid-binding protein